MRRPKVGKKKAVSCCKICACDAQGFKYRVRQHNVTYLQTRSLISGPLAETSLCPVPNNPISREIQIVLETIEQGPRACMPIHWAIEDAPAPEQASANPIAPPLPNAANQNDSRPAAVPAATAPAAMATCNIKSALPAMGVSNVSSWPVAAGCMQPNPAGFNTMPPNGDFAAGFRAAAQFYGFGPSMSGNTFAPQLMSQGMGLGLAANAVPNPDYRRQMQLMQIAAAQANYGAGVGASNQGQNDAILAQIQDMQGAAWPSAPNNTSDC